MKNVSEDTNFDVPDGWGHCRGFIIESLQRAGLSEPLKGPARIEETVLHGQARRRWRKEMLRAAGLRATA